jgi:hypothetical protein
MTTLLVALSVVFGLVLCVAVGWFWRRQEQARVARRWIERERLLDRRGPLPATKEVLRRRARRGAGRRAQRSPQVSTRPE